MTATPQLALVLRNGLLLMLSLAAVDRLGLPEGLFLALGILVILEADLGGGVIAGRERVIGSLMGLLAVVITASGSAAAGQGVQRPAPRAPVRLRGRP